MAKMMVDSNRASYTRGRNRYILSTRKFGKKWEILGNFEKVVKVVQRIFISTQTFYETQKSLTLSFLVIF
jgi:hypothetical protein